MRNVVIFVLRAYVFDDDACVPEAMMCMLPIVSRDLQKSMNGRRNSMTISEIRKKIRRFLRIYRKMQKKIALTRIKLPFKRVMIRILALIMCN